MAPEPLKPAEFMPPEGVEGIPIDRLSGKPVPEGSEGAFVEYFVKGTGPTSEAASSEEAASYLESPDL